MIKSKIKIEEVYSFIANDEIEKAFEIIKVLLADIENANLKKEFILHQSRYSRFSRNTKKGTLNNTEKENTHSRLLDSIISFTDDLDKYLSESIYLKTQKEISENLTIEERASFVNFLKETSKKDLSDIDKKEQEKLENYRDKLYKEIFSPFDEKLTSSKKTRANTASNLFHKLYTYKDITTEDKDKIYKIIKSQKFLWHEKSLIISGLTVGVLTQFNIDKIELLMDVMTDFKENLWDRAFVGVVLSFIKYDNRIELFPDVFNKIKKLQDTPVYKTATSLILEILNNKLYDRDFLIKKYSKIFQQNMSSLLYEIENNKDKLLDNLNRVNSAIESKKQIQISENNLNPLEVLQYLVEETENSDEITDIFENLGGYVNEEIKPYITDANGLDLWGISFPKEMFFKNPYKWFIPFYENNEILNHVIENTKQDDIDLKKVIEIIAHSKILDNVDKYSFFIKFNSFSANAIEFLIELLMVQNKLINFVNEIIPKDKKEELEMSFAFINIIRELYRFQTLFSQEKRENFLSEKKEIYNTKLSDLFIEQIQKEKNLFNSYFENKDYSNALSIGLRLIKINQTDKYLMKKTAKCYQEIEQFDEALQIYNSIEQEFENINNDLDKALCFLGKGEFENCKKIYEEVEISAGNIEIELISGHIELINNDKEKAIESYAGALFSEFDYFGEDFFREKFTNHFIYLKQHGIKEKDYLDMLDDVVSKGYLLYLENIRNNSGFATLFETQLNLLKK